MARDAGDPLDRLLEMALYAPVGMLLTVKEALPDWARRGRQQLDAQLPLARTVGEMAVRYGTRHARESLDKLRRQADEIVNEMSGAKTSARRPSSPTGRGPADGREAPPPPSPTAGASDVDERGGPGAVTSPSPESGDLPIPGYDTLSASQVVQRLPGLSIEELEAVRSYELAGRARKTVLLRVAQLRAAS